MSPQLGWYALKQLMKQVLSQLNSFCKIIGDRCETSLTELLSSVRETFNNQWNASVWSRINGGYVSSLCGTLDHGQALHFHEVIITN